MAIYKLPSSSTLVDGQYFTVQGPDQLFSGFQYNTNTRTMYIKDSQVVYPSFHGMTHISEDPVPDATIDLPGLMSADDKAKLESLIQMKIGILGFQGAGFPDDGGWLEGPVIFAAGSELISIERMGNVVRFTVDSPVPLSCNCESCAQIFWIQDESDVQAIRAPSCAGKLPGVNAYGEVKMYLFPESTILDQNNPTTTLNKKGQYPAFIFKRYENNTSYSGQVELVLRRNANLTSNVGWSMTPGPQNTAVAECVWYTGTDTDGRTLTFEFQPSTDPGMLGALLYNGHSITKRMGIITGRDPTVVTTNKYKVRYWDIPNQKTVGDEFTATNIWQYDNYATTPKLVSDKTVQIMKIGRLVSLWEFNIKNTSLVRRYFSDEPRLDPETIWTHTDAISFGDTLEAREETNEPTGGGDEITVTDIRTFEKSSWGIVSFPDPLYYKVDGSYLKGPFNTLFSATIDYNLPGLKIVENEDPVTGATEYFDRYERPVYIWNKVNHGNFYASMAIGQPEASSYPPIDVLFRSPIDSYDDVYVAIQETGVMSTDQYYMIVQGANWSDIPSRGTIRFLTKGRNLVWRYQKKAFTDRKTKGDWTSSVMLISDEQFPEGTEVGVFDPGLDDMSIAVILHEDYNTYCCRLEFQVNNTTGEEYVELQCRVGILDMTVDYEYNETGAQDNLVKGFMPGSYAVSKWFHQDGFWLGSGSTVSNPTNFIVYPGGKVNGGSEVWNKFEMMCRDNQLWLWWNDMLIAPDPIECSLISPPPLISVTNPYFDIAGNPEHGIPVSPAIGKYGLRLWPGTKLRTISVRDQAKGFNETLHGQLEIYDA